MFIPSVGRIVHYLANNTAKPEAGLVVAVHDDNEDDKNRMRVTLVTWNSGGTQSTRTRVEYREPTIVMPVDGKTPTDVVDGEMWHWPPRV